MTQTHIIKSTKSGLDIPALKRSSSKLVRARVTPDGEFYGKSPPGHWYVQHKGVGHYVVVHNLRRIDYGVSASKLDSDSPDVSIETSNLLDISFEVRMHKNGEPTNAPFAFALNIMDGGSGRGN